MKLKLIMLILFLLFSNINTGSAEIQTKIVFIGDSVTEGSIGVGYITKLPGNGLP